MVNQHSGKKWVKGPGLQLQSRSWKQPVHIRAKWCKTPGEQPLEIKERPILQLLWVRDKKYQEWGKSQKIKGGKKKTTWISRNKISARISASTSISIWSKTPVSNCKSVAVTWNVQAINKHKLRENCLNEKANSHKLSENKKIKKYIVKTRSCQKLHHNFKRLVE